MTEPKPCGCRGPILCRQHVQALPREERAAYWRLGRSFTGCGKFAELGKMPTLTPVVLMTGDDQDPAVSRGWLYRGAPAQL